MKRPAFMFYPADWRKDPALRVCSIAARGLWMDMLCVMHEAEPYGHLVVNGDPLSASELGRLVGESLTLVRRLLNELESRNVFSRTATGVIYSRRMVADEHIREVRAAAGKLGGNPALEDKGQGKGKDKGADNGEVNGLLKQNPKQTTEQNPTPSVAVAVTGAIADAEDPEPSPRAAGRKGRPTWLTPYGEAWKAKFGGEMPYGPAAASLAPLREQWGDAETLRRWANYLAVATPEYVNPARFASTWNRWNHAAIAQPVATNGHRLSKQEAGRAALAEWLAKNTTAVATVEPPEDTTNG